MRYGVLADLAGRVLRREPIDVTMGYFNVIWQARRQRDGARRAGAHLVAAVHPERRGPRRVERARDVQRAGAADGRRRAFTGSEAADALLSNGALARALLGAPRVDAARLVTWTADWIAARRREPRQADALRIAGRQF